MRGLFLKIFGIFWLAQTLIVVISVALIVRQRFPGPNVVSEALDSHLQHDSEVAFRAFQTNGCAGFAGGDGRYEPAGSALLDGEGNIVCRTANAPSLEGLALHFPPRVDGRELGDRHVWLVPLSGSDGKQYEYVWFQQRTKDLRPPRRGGLLHFAIPQLPVAIAVDGVTTFVLVLLFTRPLVRLRKSARALAAGDLSARVESSPKTAQRAESDEFQGLVHDFNHMAERLESLVGAQKLLLRDVSHELRSPLARLSVALELAREDAAPELGQHLHRIEREAERLNQLIAQLLALSSMEAMDNVANFQPVALQSLCEEILPDAEYEAQQRSCTVVLQPSATCPIHGNRELLYRAIENVVRNAIRYTDAGTEVTIRVAGTTVEGRDAALIEVADRGPGIPEAELERIFRPFYRLDASRTESTGGFGVGLAIAERAVRLHGGTLSAANREGGGTSIKMTFPCPAA